MYAFLMLTGIICSVPFPAPGKGQIQKSAESDASLLRSALTEVETEIALVTLAKERGTSISTRSLATQIQIDQMKLEGELKNLAAHKSIAVTNVINETVKDLKKASDRQFDRTFLRMLAKHRQILIKNFEHLFRDGTDAQLRSLAGNRLPALRRDGQRADKLAQAMPGRGVVQDPAGTSTRE